MNECKSVSYRTKRRRVVSTVLKSIAEVKADVNNSHTYPKMSKADFVTNSMDHIETMQTVNANNNNENCEKKKF